MQSLSRGLLQEQNPDLSSFYKTHKSLKRHRIPLFILNIWIQMEDEFNDNSEGGEESEEDLDEGDESDDEDSDEDW